MHGNLTKVSLLESTGLFRLQWQLTGLLTKFMTRLVHESSVFKGFLRVGGREFCIFNRIAQCPAAVMVY